MSRRRTSSDLTARARQLAAHAGIPYTAALARLRTPHTAGRRPDPGLTASTGLPGLDRLLGPLTPGTLTLLAGRTMAGSTALLLGIARHNARAGLPVILAELQTNQADTMRMLVAAESGQDLDRTAERPYDAQLVAEAAARLRGLRLRIPAPDGTDALDRLRGEAAAAGPGLLLVDDLALAADWRSPLVPGAVAAALAALARELAVPAVATAHLGARPDDPDDAGLPRPGDLRDPAALGHAHRLVLLHRPARTSPVPGRPDLVSLHASRPDGAELGTTTALFEPEYHRMTAAPGPEPA